MECIYTYKNGKFTADNLREFILNPAQHEALFWDINNDQFEKAKSLFGDIKGAYKEIYEENPRLALFEIAIQANSSSSEYNGAVNTFGQKLVDRAQDIFPTVKAGDGYESTISSFILKEFLPSERPGVAMSLKIANALSTPKAEDLFNKFYQKGNKDKFYNELVQMAGKDQVELLRKWNETNQPKSVLEMLTGMAADATYTVEITTPKKVYQDGGVPVFDADGEIVQNESMYDENNFYFNLTVPGGTNYTENEIRTPQITPSIKGHAQFSTAQGIGWFRSDDKSVNSPEAIRAMQMEFGDNLQGLDTGSKTRRILEVQSDLFQKGRDKKDLVGTVEKDIADQFGEDAVSQISPEYMEKYGKIKTSENQFLQLLNKDNHWVTFFIKSIIQDSARKGYEKILFPVGDTAARIEGHGTIEDFIKLKKARLAEIDKQIANRDETNAKLDPIDPWSTVVVEFNEGLENERDQILLEIERAEAGTLKISAVAAFYETNLFNVLKKNYGADKIQKIKDEYGNGWYELSINETRDVMPIVFNQRSWEDELISKLQNHDIIGKKKHNNEYWLKKTVFGAPTGTYTPQETERRNLDKIEYINKHIGYEAVKVRQTPGGYIVKVNVQPGLFHNITTLPESLDQIDTVDFLDSQIFDGRINPVTTSVLNNLAGVARDLERQDLVESARFIYRYMSKNTSVKIHIAKTREEFLSLQVQKPPEGFSSGGFYDPNNNTIILNGDAMAYRTVENTLEVILEELMHSITVTGLYEELDNSAAASIYRKEVGDLFNKYKAYSSNISNKYRFSHEAEFIAGLTTDRAFREELANAKLPFFRRLWDSFINAVKRFMNIPIEKDNPAQASDTMFQVISDYLSSIDKVGLVGNNLKEVGRNYDLQFTVVPNSMVEDQKSKVLNKLSDEYKEEFKSRVRKLVDFLRANSGTKGTIDADDNFFFLFKEARRLHENILDEVDYLFSFINELSAMTSVAVDKMRAIRDSNQSQGEKIIQFTRVNTTISQYTAIIKELESIKEKVLIGTPLERSINEISSNTQTIHWLFNENIVPLVSNKIVDLARPAAEIANVQQKAKIEKFEKLLEGARKRGDKTRVKVLEEKLNKERKFLEDKLTITPQMANDTLLGLYGDSNSLTAWLESTAVNPNLAVSSVAKATADAYSSIAPLISANNNQFQTAIDSYEKNSGRNINNIDAFNKPFIQQVKIIDGIKEDGEFEYKEKLALLTPWNLNYIQEIQKFTYRNNNITNKISRSKDDTEKAALIKERQELIKERKQFTKDYMEQPYLDEVHDAMELMDEDLGGFTAREAINDLYDKRTNAERTLENARTDAEVDQILEVIDSYDFEIKRLRYIPEGTDPNSREYKLAEQLKKYDEAIKKYREYKLTPRKKNQFLANKKRVDDRHASGLISDKERDHWYQKNTITEYSQQYWEDKKALLDQLKEVRQSLGITVGNQDINDLYKKLESMVKVYRDSENIINGRLVPQNEVKIVKEIEETIEKIKGSVEGIDGLTMAEKTKLRDIAAEMDILDIELASTWNPSAQAVLNSRLDDLSNEMTEIASKKKKLDKKQLQKYFELTRKLAEMDRSSTTEYYEDEKDIQINNLMTSVSVTSLPGSFSEEGVKYSKQGDIWVRIVDGKQELVDTIQEVEDAYRHLIASERLTESEWYKNNHITRSKYVQNPNYDPSVPTDQRGWYEQVDEPIYIWRHVSPALEQYILKDQPANKYKTSSIKAEFRNKSFGTSPDGYNIPKLQGAKDDRFVNKEYIKLASSSASEDKATYKALQFLTEKYKEAQSYLPQRFKPGYFLPSIRKSGTERTLGTKPADIKEKITGIFKTVKDELVKNEQDKDILFGYSETLSSVPMKYIGDIDIEDQTRDVFQSILLFNSEAIKRKGLMEALPFALAVKNIVSAEENKPVKLDSKGAIVTLARRMTGNKFLAKLIPGESQTARQLNEFIRTYYFGEAMKDEIGAKPLNTILGWGAKALLGMNYSASIVNRMNAWTQSFLETESKRGAFGKKEMFKAQAIYTANVPNFMKDLGKYGNKSLISQMFDYFGGSNLNIIEEQSKTLAYAKLTEGIGKVLIPNEMAEHAIGYNLFIAMSLKKQVKQGDKMIPLFEAFHIKNGVLELKPNVQFSERDRSQFINRMNAAARRINGAYGLLDKVQAHKYALGRLGLFMNQYFIPFLTRRFGNQRFSIEDGITDEGYWKTFGKSVFTFNNNVIANWKNYSDEEKVAIARASTEIGFSLMAIALIAVLGGDDPEDIKKNGWAANMTIFTLKMFRRQNEQFMLIPGLGLDDIYQKLKSPFPIMGKLGNTFSIFNHLMYQAGYVTLGTGKESDFMYTRKTGWHTPGDLKVTSDISKLLGLTYRFSQMNHPDIAIQNMDAYRIK